MTFGAHDDDERMSSRYSEILNYEPLLATLIERKLSQITYRNKNPMFSIHFADDWLVSSRYKRNYTTRFPGFPETLTILLQQDFFVSFSYQQHKIFTAPIFR